MADFAHTLTSQETSRYSRQLILPEIGVQGQQKLKRTSVLIVGAGGLGCPCAVYLAAAGIGILGVIDYDEVELNNLHRQILHTESNIGLSKAKSVVKAVQQLNSSVECIAFEELISSRNALSMIEKFDIVVDATDNVATRYLLNDACVLSKKPLVSGSALRFEGQLTIYNHLDGPCYRCLYPIPPNPEMVTNCSDGGVIGAVPGIIGTLQALEVIKLAVGLPVTYCKQLLIFDGLRGTFRNVKLRSKLTNCMLCGEDPTLKELIDYELFCGSGATDKEHSIKLLNDDERLTCKAFKSMVDEGIPHILIDVRQPAELDICKLSNAYNIPISKVDDPEYLQELKMKIETATEVTQNNQYPVIVVCRRGNDSQLAVRSLQKSLEDLNISIKDIRGGLYSWAADIDPDFPLY